MRVVLIIVAVVAFAVGALGFWAYRSDIQLIIAFLGVFSGFILLGLASILHRLDRFES